MHKTNLIPTLNPSASLCHLHGTLLKDLQTNFPEIFHESSAMYRTCFTSPFFTKNRLNREMPQPMPAARVAIARNAVTHLMSLSTLQDLRATSARVFTLDPLTPRPLGPFFRLLSPSNLRTAAPTISPSKACARAHKCIAQFEPRMGRRVVATGAASSGTARPAQPVVSFAARFPPRQGNAVN